MLDRAGIQRRFKEKVKQATADPAAMPGQDWGGLDAIVVSLTEVLRG